MTTPHAPEGGVNAARFTQADAATEPAHYLAEREAHLVRMSNAVSPSLANEARNSLCWFRADVLAARAEGATAERARLAGMASEEDRKMVEAFGLAVFAVAVATERRNFDMAIAEKSGAAKVTLLARLAAARGERDEAIRQLGVALGRIAAADRAGDDDGDGEYILSLQRQLAEVKAQLDAALKAVDITPFTEEIRRLAALVAAMPDALTEARRDGAELALGVVFESDPLAAKQVLAALFPPPGAEVGRG